MLERSYCRVFLELVKRDKADVNRLEWASVTVCYLLGACSELCSCRRVLPLACQVKSLIALDGMGARGVCRSRGLDIALVLFVPERVHAVVGRALHVLLDVCEVLAVTDRDAVVGPAHPEQVHFEVVEVVLTTVNCQQGVVFISEERPHRLSRLGGEPLVARDVRVDREANRHDRVAHDRADRVADSILGCDPGHRNAAESVADVLSLDRERS